MEAMSEYEILLRCAHRCYLEEYSEEGLCSLIACQMGGKLKTVFGSMTAAIALRAGGQSARPDDESTEGAREEEEVLQW